MSLARLPSERAFLSRSIVEIWSGEDVKLCSLFQMLAISSNLVSGHVGLICNNCAPRLLIFLISEQRRKTEGFFGKNPESLIFFCP